MALDGKPLGPNALADENEHRAFLEKCAKDLAKSEQPKRQPTPAPAPRYVTEDALGPLLKKIGAAIAAELKPLRQRIAELEAREWVGVWESGKSYAKNAIVSHDGSAWVATREFPEGKPGTANSGFRLIVKRGKDGRDAK